MECNTWLLILLEIVVKQFEDDIRNKRDLINHWLDLHEKFGILFIPGFALWASGRGSPRLHRAWARVPVAGLQRGMAVFMDGKKNTSNRFHNFPHLFIKFIKRMTDVCSWLPTSIDDMLCLYNVQSPPSQTYMILVGYDFDWGLGESLLFILFWVCGCSRVPCFMAQIMHEPKMEWGPRF